MTKHEKKEAFKNVATDVDIVSRKPNPHQTEITIVMTGNVEARDWFEAALVSMSKALAEAGGGAVNF